MKICKSKRTPSKQDWIRGKIVRVNAPDSAEKVFCSDFPFQELFVNDDLIGVDEGDIQFFQYTAAENGVETSNGRDIVEKFTIIFLQKNRIESVNGAPSLEQKFFLFSCNLPEDEIKQNFPFLWTYIQNGNEKGISSGYICSRRTPWYNCEKSKPAPFVMPYMGRSDVGHKLFRFILNN